MNIQQNYLQGSCDNQTSILTANSPEFKKILKRLSEPTLRSCNYNQENFIKSMRKRYQYQHKFGTCILLVAKFYLDQIRRARFNPNQPQKFSITNLHGVFSSGLFLESVEIAKIENGERIIEKKQLKRPKHHNNKHEVDFITSQFLILDQKASFHNGPALWKFRELNLEDPILVEISNLVDVYHAQLDMLISNFHNARFQDETRIEIGFIEPDDVQFLEDVVRIWMH